MPSPKSDDALKHFNGFVEEVRKRLEAGKETYGDSSFTRPVEDIAREIQCECLDLAGWGFILYCRVEAMRQAISEIPVSPGMGRGTA